MWNIKLFEETWACRFRKCWSCDTLVIASWYFAREKPFERWREGKSQRSIGCRSRVGSRCASWCFFFPSFFFFSFCLWLWNVATLSLLVNLNDFTTTQIGNPLFIIYTSFSKQDVKRLIIIIPSDNQACNWLLWNYQLEMDSQRCQFSKLHWFSCKSSWSLCIIFLYSFCWTFSFFLLL